MSQLKWNLALITNIFNQLEEQKKTDFLFVSSQLTEEADTVYGSTKRLGEVWTNLLKGVCVRVWNAYGVMEEQDIKSHVISDFIYQALQTGKITMMTNGQEWRQFTHINDLCNAFYMALNTKDLRKTVYDASSYEWVRIIDIAQIISDSTGAKLIPGKIKGHDPLPADNMGRVPGWLPSIELKDGIQKIVNQAKEILKNDKKNKTPLSNNSSVLFATFSKWIDNKRLPTNGSIEPLRDFLVPRVKKLVIIDQLHPGSHGVMPKIEEYRNNNMKFKTHNSSIFVLLVETIIRNVSFRKYSN